MTTAAEGRNLVISTGTASGKSPVFQSAAFRMLDADDEAAVIVFYPLKHFQTISGDLGGRLRSMPDSERTAS